MEKFQFILEPYKGKGTRHECPSCKEAHQFARYINIDTGEYLGTDIGKCNHIGKCGYHKPPRATKCYFIQCDVKEYSDKQYNLTIDKRIYYIPSSQIYEVVPGGCYASEWILDKENIINRGDVKYFTDEGVKATPTPIKLPLPPKPVSYIDDEIFDTSLQTPLNNNFIKYLISIFGVDLTDDLIGSYYIGTSKHWGGGTTVFWQLDEQENIRAGKLIKYNETTGKRLKKPFIHTNWIHSILKLENFNLKQCFFGTHLINREENKNKTIGIVESEKTAIIALGYLPKMVWLASGSAEGINKDKIKALEGRKVILYPDTSKDSKMFAKWEQKAIQYGFEISTYLKDNTTAEEKAEGLDLADFLTKQTNKPKEKEEEKHTHFIKDNEQITGEIPYFSSPAYTIDKGIKNAPKFKGNDLVIKNRIFDNIEIVGTRDYGRCESKGHKWEGICPYCMYNCIHTIKINGEVQSRKYSQLEILIMQNNKKELIKVN